MQVHAYGWERSVIEELPQPDREQPAAIQRMLKARRRQGGSLGVAGGEQQPAGKCEGHGKRVAEDDVQEGERGGTEDDQRSLRGEERCIPLEEEGAVKQSL